MHGQWGEPRDRAGPATTPGAVFIIVALLAILLASWLSFATRPTAQISTTWWPAAGVALGLGLRLPSRHLWILAPIVSITTLPLLLWAGRPLPVAIVFATAVGVELVVGTLIFRGRANVRPRLAALSDFTRLMLAASAASVVYAVMTGAALLVFGSQQEALTQLITAAPKHAAGILLITPLFMDVPRRRRAATVAEELVQTAFATAVVVFIFITNNELPLAFLAFVPLVWAATRLTTRKLLVQILVVAAVASFASTRGDGPFAFDVHGPETGGVLLQLFELTMVVTLITLSLMVGLERDTAARLHRSEELFRTSFASSVAGQLMVSRSGSQWIIRERNPAAAAMLPEVRDGAPLEAVLGHSATDTLTTATTTLDDGNNTRLYLTTDEGRSLDVSIAAIGDHGHGEVFALHFFDVTEALRVRRLEQAELDRAGEVQRALVPGHLPVTPGWSIGAVSVPAKQVGGDFYDIRLHMPHAVVSLGDVMGKGMGAGMLAAATRSALRSSTPDTRPAVAVAHAAEVLQSDLQTVGAFITMSYALVDLISGDFRSVDAGHGLHFVLRASGQVERLASEDMPVGLDSAWEELHGTLHPGDGILVVSDGLMEVWGGSVADLHDAVARCVQRFAGVGAQALVEAMCAESDPSDDRDDVTAVLLKRDAAARH